MYTKESRDAVTEAINSVIYNKTTEEQDTVNGYYYAIVAAADALVEEKDTGDIKWIENQTYELGSGEDAIVKIDYVFSLFKKVVVDDKELVLHEDYELEEGSTIIILTNKYLETLPVGEHTLIAYYSDGKSFSTTFTVIDEDIVVPDTGTEFINKNFTTESLAISSIGIIIILSATAVVLKRKNNQ